MKSNFEELPQPIKNKLQELNELVEQNPNYIPLTKCASFIGMDDDGLRRSIESNQCPFGLGWKRLGADNRGFKIPTLTFYMWYTHANLLINA